MNEAVEPTLRPVKDWIFRRVAISEEFTAEFSALFLQCAFEGQSGANPRAITTFDDLAPLINRTTAELREESERILEIFVERLLVDRRFKTLVLEQVVHEKSWKDFFTGEFGGFWDQFRSFLSKPMDAAHPVARTATILGLSFVSLGAGYSLVIHPIFKDALDLPINVKAVPKDQTVNLLVSATPKDTEIIPGTDGKVEPKPGPDAKTTLGQISIDWGHVPTIPIGAYPLPTPIIWTKPPDPRPQPQPDSNSILKGPALSPDFNKAIDDIHAIRESIGSRTSVDTVVPPKNTTLLEQVRDLQTRDDEIRTLNRVSTAVISDALKVTTTELGVGETVCVLLNALDADQHHKPVSLQIHLVSRIDDSATIYVRRVDCQPNKQEHAETITSGPQVNLVQNQPTPLNSIPEIRVPYDLSFVQVGRNLPQFWKSKVVLRFQPDVSGLN